MLDVPVPETDGEDLHAALADLATYSLVTSAPELPYFAVHRLMQDVTARSLDPVGGRTRLTRR